MKKVFNLAFAIALLGCNNPQTTMNALTKEESNAPSFSLEGRTASIYTSADTAGYRLLETDSGKGFTDMGQPKETQVCVFADPSKAFQTIVGIGGAITDAAAETLAKLPAATQDSLLNAYYDPAAGIGYTLARTNINSCDFSSDTYNYVADNDSLLNSFNIAHDEKYKLPFIKRAMAIAKGKLKLFVSPWSPPAWMKDNNDMLHGGSLKKDFYHSWAEYYIKYINALEKQAIPVWGLSVQNEPMATQKWESCIYTAEQEADFIKTALGPALEKAGIQDKKLIIWDHNRDLIYQRASTTLADPDVAKYVWGIGYHWYETWTGSDMMFENLRRTAEAFPGKQLLFTEGCREKFSMDSIHNWNLGEKYGMSMINDFNAGAAGWTDWNVLLDETGGPNHVGNFCFAPVHADTRTGRLIYTSAYYYLGHFSKFVRPGARRIAVATNRTDLLGTGFLNTDGRIAVIVMNKGGHDLQYNLWIKGKAVAINALKHSIQTILI
ncbi:glycosyl hydrolase [Niabella ginsenosidivorans]|uniref:Glycosyl hydrolase n=1 Tax=Niabella ginsenosidivorans TaxID=1176587 RepID=A0A1A9I9S1_9BACT|nr:glycoside hydrolase family 30 protein [Niabella ginsenosidivorans]ANH83421.1 glycosyl hydrolase [Niabella ginsenosidivorans]